MTNESMAALRRARETLADLEDQQAEASQTANNLQARRQQLGGEIAALKHEADERHAEVIRGRGDIYAVENLRRTQHEIEQALALHANEERLCHDVQTKVDSEVAAARRALAKALEDAAHQSWEPIERALRSNTKVRAQLVEIFSTVHAACMSSNGGMGGVVDWERVLIDAFPAPTDEEFAAGIEVACRRLATEE